MKFKADFVFRLRRSALNPPTSPAFTLGKLPEIAGKTLFGM